MNLLQELLELQHARGYLPESELIELCQTRAIPRAKVEELCSFYPHLRRTPAPEHRLSVCRDLACQMQGADQAQEQLKTRCTERGDVEFEAVSCLGRCDTAPACSLDDVPLTAAEAVEALGSSSVTVPNESIQPDSTPHWRIDPHAKADDQYATLRRALAEPRDTGRLIQTLIQSGLRGMGGAGFPTGRKWEVVAAQPATPRYVICNADESEPGTFKDRVMLRDLPHLVIEGMVLAGLAIDSHEAWVYIRHEYAPELSILRKAIERAREMGALGENIFGSGFDFDIEIFVSPGGYILGEETAMLEALEGRRGEPRNKPPYPGISGLHGLPTVINNVETFVHVPGVLERGTVDYKFFSISGDVQRPGVFEVPIGTTMSELLALAGGVVEGDELLAFLPGGASTGLLSAEHIDIPMTWDALREVGSALGSGAVIVIGAKRNLLEVAGNLTAFFRNESCGKCVPCRIGTEKAVKLIEMGDASSLATLSSLREVMEETSICGLGQAALNPISSVLENFPDVVSGDSVAGGAKKP